MSGGAGGSASNSALVCGQGRRCATYGDRGDDLQVRAPMPDHDDRGGVGNHLIRWRIGRAGTSQSTPPLPTFEANGPSGAVLLSASEIQAERPHRARHRVVERQQAGIAALRDGDVECLRRAQTEVESADQGNRGAIVVGRGAFSPDGGRPPCVEAGEYRGSVRATRDAVVAAAAPQPTQTCRLLRSTGSTRRLLILAPDSGIRGPVRRANTTGRYGIRDGLMSCRG